MWYPFVYFIFVTIIYSKVVFCEFVTINWTDSPDLPNSRLYEYPVYDKVSSCDLTANVCDIDCCTDSDCDNEQKKSFNCSHLDNSCRKPLARYDCNCPSDKPRWFPVLCYVFRNPIYLGMFYKTVEKIENLNDFLRISHSGKFKYDQSELINDRKQYVFGLPVLAYISVNESYTPFPHALLHENNIAGRISPDCHVSVKYMQNKKDNCYVKITKEECENGLSLSAKPYLLRNDSLADDIPLILKNLETEQPSPVYIRLKDSTSSHIVKNFRGKLQKYFFLNGEAKSHNYDTDLFHTVWSGSTCFNVIAKAVYNFTTNGTEIVKVEIEIHLTNVSVTGDSDLVYLKLVHDINFDDINKNVWNFSNEYLKPRGYNIGEDLNFGYLRRNGSNVTWERGHLKMFLNGGVCQRSRDITFGYNSYGTCLHQSKHPTCSQVRKEIILSFDSLIDGESLAPYGGYRDVRRTPISILRSYNTSEWDDGNDTYCLLPTRQDLYIQYTSTRTPKGFTLREVVGVMVNRCSSFVSDLDSVPLTYRIYFLEVEAVKKKPLSRFWKKIYSPEKSENAWMNIFNIFDRPVTEEEAEESTFWFLLPVVVGLITVMLVRDNR